MSFYRYLLCIKLLCFTGLTGVTQAIEESAQPAVPVAVKVEETEAAAADKKETADSLYQLAVTSQPEALRTALSKADISDEYKQFLTALNFYKRQSYQKAFVTLDSVGISKFEGNQVEALALYVQSLSWLEVSVEALRPYLLKVEEVYQSVGKNSDTVLLHLALNYLRLGDIEKASTLIELIKEDKDSALYYWVKLKCSVVPESSEDDYQKILEQIASKFDGSELFKEELILAKLDREFLQGTTENFESILTEIINLPDEISLLSRLIDRVEKWSQLADEAAIERFIGELNVLLLSTNLALEEEANLALKYLISFLEYSHSKKFSKNLTACFEQEILINVKSKAALILSEQAIAEVNEALFEKTSAYLLKNSKYLEEVGQIYAARMDFSKEDYAKALKRLSTLSSGSNYLKSIIGYNINILRLLTNQSEVKVFEKVSSPLYIDSLIAQAYLQPKGSLENLRVLIEAEEQAPSDRFADIVLAYTELSIERGHKQLNGYRALLNLLNSAELEDSASFRYWAMLSKINILDGEKEAALESLQQLSSKLVLNKDLYWVNMTQINLHLLLNEPLKALTLLEGVKSTEEDEAKLTLIYYLSGLAHYLIETPESRLTAEKYFLEVSSQPSPYQEFASFRLAELYFNQQQYVKSASLFETLHVSAKDSRIRFRASIFYVQSQIDLIKNDTATYEDIALVCDGVLADPEIDRKTNIKILFLKAQAAEFSNQAEEAIRIYESALKLSEGPLQPLGVDISRNLVRLLIERNEFKKAYELALKTSTQSEANKEEFEGIANKIYLERLIWLDEADSPNE